MIYISIEGFLFTRAGLVTYEFLFARLGLVTDAVSIIEGFLFARVGLVTDISSIDSFLVTF